MNNPMGQLRCWMGVVMVSAGLSVAATAVAQERAMMMASMPDDVVSLEAVADAFLPATQWQPRDAQALQVEIRQRLGAAGGSTLFHPDADTGPLSKALLVLMAEEADLPHSRVRLRYARARVAPPGQAPVPVELVEIARFNLGPARREALIEQLGTSRVAPEDAFGNGPHVAWRLITRPVMGQVADITHVARREVPIEVALCLSAPCSTADSLNEQARDWPEPTPVELTSRSLPLEVALLEATLERLGLVQRDHRGLGRWQLPEWPESVPSGEAFLEVVVEHGVGQDDGVDLVVYLDQLMDDHTKALWQRLMAWEADDGHLPQVWATQDQEPWPRPAW